MFKKRRDMKYPCTGVVLAGGRNTRFGGKNKAFIPVCGKTVLARILEAFSGFFEDILLVTKSPLDYLDYDVAVAADVFPAPGSLAGVHAGLFYSETPYVFFAACDTPFLKKEIIRLILDSIEDGCDAVIPETEAGMEPLCAVYSKACLSHVEQHLHQNRLKITRVFQKKRVVRIPEGTLREKDPDLISFMNINTPDDLKRAAIAMGLKPPDSTDFL